jgi:hypothetical protein
MNVNHNHNNALRTALIINGLLIANYLFWIFGNPSQVLSIALILALGATLFLLFQNAKENWPVLAFIFFASFVSLQMSSTGWDARLTWLFHAKRIFYDGSLYAQLDNYSNGHNDYPVMVPALSATIAKALGFWNEVLPKSASVFFLVGALTICGLALQGTVLLVFVTGFACLSGSLLLNGYMDAVLAIYTCSIIFLILLQIQTNFPPYITKPKHPKIFFALLLCSLIVVPLIKNEGIMILACFAVAALVSPKPFPKKAFFLALLLAILFYFATWKLPVLNAGIVNDLMAGNPASHFAKRIQNLEASKLIAQAILKHMSWEMITLIAVLILPSTHRRRQLFPLVFIASYLAVLFCVYLATPSDLVWHISTTIDRTLLPVNVTIIGLALFELKHQAWLVRINHKTKEWRLVYKLIAIVLIFLGLFWASLKAIESPFELHQPITFNKGGNGIPYLRDVGNSNQVGWGHPEDWGSWIIGSQASLVLPIPRLPAAHYLDLQFELFEPKKLPQQTVTVWINERPWKSVELTSEHPAITDIPIPPFWQSQTPLMLELKGLKPSTPKALGMVGEDDRLLSIGLKSAVFK